MNKMLIENMDKLSSAKSAEDIAKILESAGEKVTNEAAEQLFKEIQAHPADTELSADELDAVSGGADRNWLINGCAATVESNSFCFSNDRCIIWDVTYKNEPVSEKCPTCGIGLYVARKNNNGVVCKCRNCDYTKTYMYGNH